MKTTWFLMDVGESDAFSVFDALPTGCILVDNEKILATNQSFVELVGAESKLSILELDLANYLDHPSPLSNDVLESAAATKKQLYLKVKTGTGTIPATAQVSRQVDAQKNKRGFLMSLSAAQVQTCQAKEDNNGEDRDKMLFSSLMTLTDSYYIYYNLDKEVVAFSQTAFAFHSDILCVTLEKGQHYSLLAYPDDINKGNNDYLTQARALGSIKRQCNLRDAKNNKRYFDIDYQLTVDAEGNPTGFVEFCREVTSSVELAIENKSAQFTLQGLIDNSTDTVVIYDTDLNFVFFNDAFINTLNYYWGLVPKVGANYQDIFVGIPDLEAKLDARRAVVNDGQECKTSFTLKSKDNRNHYFRNHLSPLRNHKNKIVAVVSRTVDVTEEVRKNRELEKSNSTLKAIMESSLSGICAFDANYNVVAYNQTAYGEFLRYTGVDLSLPGSIKEQLDPQELLRWDRDLFSRVLKGESFSTIVRRKEDDRVHRNNYTPVINNKGEIIATLEMSQDITDYVKSKTELQENQDRMKMILDRNPAGIARLDLAGRIKYVSQKGAAFLGKQPSELEGKIAKEVVDASIYTLFEEKAKQLINGEDSVFLDLEFDKGIKEPKIYAQGIVTLIRKDNGDPEEFFLSFLDVTERRRSLSLLEKSQDTYQMLFSNMLDAVIVWNKTTRKIEVVNKSAEKLLGRSAKQLRQTEFCTLVPETSNFLPGKEVRKDFMAYKERILRGEQVAHKNFVVTRADNTERLVELQVLNLKEEMEIVYMTLVDVTDIYRAQKEIIKNSSIFESLIHNSFDGIDVIRYEKEKGLYVNPQLIVRNEQMDEMLGEGAKGEVFDSLEQYMSISPEKQLDGEQSEVRLKKAFQKTLKTGQNQTEFRLQHSNGTTIDVVASQKIVPVDNDVFLIKNLRNISKEVEARNIIQSQIEEAQEKNKELEKYIESNLQLENFAYIASHDLKAPIRSVISFAQLLKNNVYKDLDDKNQRFLDIMISASTNMQVLIDDLLAYSRINTQAIEFEKLDVQKLLDYLLIEIGSTIADKNGEVIIGKMPQSVVADNTRIRQVFQNLITNAMKFHKEGELPKVEVSYQDFPSRYEFSVRDYGIGVEEKYLSEIFLMFKKLHSENKFKGTGIGLSICKKIAEQHGGTIRAESTIGEGTTIIFSISKSLEVNI